MLGQIATISAVVALLAFLSESKVEAQAQSCRAQLDPVTPKHLQAKVCANNTEGGTCKVFCEDGYVVENNEQENFVEIVCKFIKASKTLQWKGIKKCIEKGVDVGDTTRASTATRLITTTTPATTTATTTAAACPTEPDISPWKNIEIPSCENTSTRDKCEVKCKRGFKFGFGTNANTRQMMSCQRGGSWTSASLKMCTKLVSKNLEIMRTGCSRNIDDTCTVRCKPGYGDGTTGKKYITCQLQDSETSGKWVGYEDTMCTQLPCDPLPNLDSGVQPGAVGDCNAEQGSECTLGCSRGYVFPSGDKERKVECLKRGADKPTWPAKLGNCRKMKCLISQFTDENLDTSDCIDKAFGSSCTVTCKRNYKFASGGPRDIDCVLNGADEALWSPLPNSIETCQAIECPNIITSLENSHLESQRVTVTTTKCQVGVAKPGWECSLTCPDGYAFGGKDDDKQVICDEETENWNPSLDALESCSLKILGNANCEYWSSGTDVSGRALAESECKRLMGGKSVLAMPKTENEIEFADDRDQRYFVGAGIKNNSASWNDGADISTIAIVRSGPKKCITLKKGKLLPTGCKSQNHYMCERPTESYDACDPNPCKSGGICRPLGCSFLCDCPENFFGLKCEKAPFEISITTARKGSSVTINYSATSNNDKGKAKFELFINGEVKKKLDDIGKTKKNGEYVAENVRNDLYISGKIFLNTKPDNPFYTCKKVAVMEGDKSTNITNDICDGTVLHVEWKGLSSDVTSTLPYDVYVDDKLRGSSSSKFYKIEELKSATDYKIKVVPHLEGCTESDLFENVVVKTSRGLPEPSVVKLRRTVKQPNLNCTINWSNKRAASIDGFKIKIAEKIRNSADLQIAEIFEHEVSKMSYSFSTKPNSVYEIMVGNRPPTTCQNVPITWSNTTSGCRTDTAPPSKVRLPVIVMPRVAGDGVSIMISPVDERNGQVSCYIIVVKQTNSTASENSTFTPITDIDQLAQANETIDGESAFVALALTRSNETIVQALGDGQTTCCDMTSSGEPCGLGGTRRRRAVSDTVRGENRQLDPNARYTHYVIVSTPTDSGGPAVIASPLSTPWSLGGGNNEDENDPQNNIGLSVGLPIFFVVLAVLLVAALIYRRQHAESKVHPVPADHSLMPFNSKRNQDDHSDELIEIDIVVAPDKVIERYLGRHGFQLSNLYQIMENKRADEDMLFFEEFKNDINKAVEKCGLTSDISHLPANRSKNRYKNIVPYDKSRVVLEKIPGYEFSDYINAGYIDGHRYPRKFIATQGPQPETIADFWRMIWEQGSYIIAILTKLVEKKKVKCAQYWSDEEGVAVEYEGTAVTLQETTTCGDYVRRRFQIARDGETRDVFQFHFIAWPDHGIPITTSSVLRFHKSVMYSQPASAGPIVVHCSAGVGRTGTFIALDILSEQIMETEEINICAVVGRMRTRRPDMVQTLDQYILIHKLVLETYQFGETDVDVAGFNSAYSNLRRVNGERSEVEQEFAMLDYFWPLDTDQETGQKQANKHLNRISSILPYDHNAAFIQMNPTDRVVPYYNASIISSYHTTDKFIAAQTPDEDSADMFWRTVLDNDVSMIVALCEAKAMENYCYWPKRSQEEKYGLISVRNLEETSDMGCVERKFEISNRDKKITVSQIFYGQWSEKVVPASSGIVLEIISRVEKHHQTLTKYENKTTLVHCSDGAGRSGTFCAISNLIERLKNENRVDVFRIVKDLRDQRPMMVQSVEQYEFCYQAVSEFLQSFDLYGNFQ